MPIGVPDLLISICYKDFIRLFNKYLPNIYYMQGNVLVRIMCKWAQNREHLIN